MGQVVLAGQDDTGASIDEVQQEVAVVEQVVRHHLLDLPWQMVGNRLGTFLDEPLVPPPRVTIGTFSYIRGQELPTLAPGSRFWL